MPLPTVTPAHIFYTPTDGGEEQRIDFHTIIFEDHQTVAEITKYPVQTGIHVSNHSIRKNRIVSIEGLITNTMISGTEHAVYDYGLKATNTVKAVMDSLINTGTECRVVTNLGTYNPVVFSKFKTKQQKGLVDSMQFNLTGEEIIKVDVAAGGAAANIIFSEVPSINRPAAVEELATIGVAVADWDTIQEGYARPGEDFVVTGKEQSGIEVRTEYKFAGTNPTTGEPIYEIHLGDSAVAVTGYPGQGESTECTAAVPDANLGGIKQVSNCLVSEATSVTASFAEDMVQTAMGELAASARGVFYDVTTFNSEYGSALVSAGLGCVIRGITRNESEGTYLPGESLPTTEQIMSGLAKGLGISYKPSSESIKLTKIVRGCASDDPLTGLVPPISVI